MLNHALVSLQVPVATRRRRENIAAINYADIRLAQWGRWARSQSASLGYPQLSLIYKILRRRDKRLGTLSQLLQLRVKRLTARGIETRSLQPKTVGEVPNEIVEVDRAVASLEALQRQIIRAEYLMPEDPIEVKAMAMAMLIAEYRSVLRRAKLHIGMKLGCLMESLVS